MTAEDYFAIFTRLFGHIGPYRPELSKPPKVLCFGDETLSGDATTGEITIGGTIIHTREFVDEVKLRHNNDNGKWRTIIAQLVAEIKAYNWDDTFDAVKALGYTDAEIEALKPGVAESILAAYRADPVPGFKCLPPSDSTSPAHRKAVAEFYALVEVERPPENVHYGSVAVAYARASQPEEKIALEQPTTADLIPFPLLKTKHPDLSSNRGSSFAAAVREAIKVYAKTGKLLDAALVFARHGIPVFPCDPVTKVPIPRRDRDPTGKYPGGIPGTGGFKKATTDPITITRWWTHNPHALIAVPMGPRSGVWCVDVDTALEHEDESVTAWNALIAEHGLLETREHRSASGGPHAFLKWKDEQPIGCSPGQMPKGISIKGDGGYVIVPPSVRKGRAYTVHRDIDPIDASQWLIDKILAGKPPPKRDPKSPHSYQPFDGTPLCDLDELAEAMRFIPNDNPSREFWVNWGLAIFAASGGNQRGLEIFDEWSRKWPGYDAEDTDQRWYEMTGSPPNRTGANKIFKAARRYGWQPRLKATPPTYASATNSPAAGRDRMREIVRSFLFAVDNPEPGQDNSNTPPLPIARAVRIDVGVGKTEIVIEELAIWLKQKKRDPIIYATPRHNLNESVRAQFTKRGINTRIYYGREADDPQRPGLAMCVNLPAVRLAKDCHAEIAPTCCQNKKQRCHFFNQCGFQRQLRDREDIEVWIVAIDTLFHVQNALGKPCAVIIDERLWEKGVHGVEVNEDWSVAVDSISNTPPPPKTPDNISDYGRHALDFLHLCHQLASALHSHPNDGGIERKYFDEVSFNATSCTTALNTEWGRYNADLKKLGQHPGMSELELNQLASKERLIDSIQHTRRRIQILEELREFLNNADITVSGRLTLGQKNGQRIIRWRGIKQISSQFKVPTLLLDATLPELPMLQLYHPRAEIVADIKVKLPKSVHIRQILGTPTSARKLNPAAPKNYLADIRRHILTRYLELNRPLALVICQQRVEEWLRPRLPDDIAVEHYKNITGIDAYRDVRFMALIGRTAPTPVTTEIITAALTGKSPIKLANNSSNGFRWFDQVQRSIRLRDGSGIATNSDHHPDPDVETVRFQIHEAELVQALGRARGVNRTMANPLDVDLLFDTPIPITVDQVERWQPPNLLIETAIDGVMLTSPRDLVKLWPTLWPNRKLAFRTLQQGVPTLPGFEPVEYQLAGAKMKKRVGYFNLTLIPDPHSWLKEKLGPLA